MYNAFVNTLPAAELSCQQKMYSLEGSRRLFESLCLSLRLSFYSRISSGEPLMEAAE